MSEALVCLGGPWDGQRYASHTPDGFVVHEFGAAGAIVRSHRYLLTNRDGQRWWRYAGLLH